MATTKAQRKIAQEQYDTLFNNRPTYTSKYQQQIDSLLDSINNRQPFSYDFNADPLYSQYKDRYQQQGKLAMLDTQAGAAALSGGYDNSYANTAGQLSYQSYLQGLNDIIPDLQSNAYSRYETDGNDMYNRLGAYQTQESQDYSKYRDSLSDYYDQLSYWAGIAGSGGSGGGKNSGSLSLSQAVNAIGQISNMDGGVTNSDLDELAAATKSKGMSTDAIRGALAYANYYSTMDQKAKKTTKNTAQNSKLDKLK